MADIQTTDELLVNRGDVTYTQQQGTLMANLQDTDYLLLNRSDVTYKITGEDLIDSVIDPLTLDITILPDPPIADQEVTATAIPQGGKLPYTVNSYQWYFADDITGTNSIEIAGETTDVYTPLQSSRDKFLGCEVSITDSRGTSVTEINYVGPISIIEVAPIIESVTLTESASNIDAWTNAEYITDIELIQGTEPLTYSIKPYITGNLTTTLETSAIVDVQGAGSYQPETSLITSVTNVNLTAPTVTCTDVNNLPLSTLQYSSAGGNVLLNKSSVSDINDCLCNLVYNDPPGSMINVFPGGTAVYAGLGQVDSDTTFTFTYTGGPGTVLVGCGQTSQGTIIAAGDCGNKTHIINPAVYDNVEIQLSKDSGTFTLQLVPQFGAFFIDIFHVGFGIPSDIIQLELTDDKDLEYFSIGDVVQSQVFSENITTTGNNGTFLNPGNIFDANETNSGHANGDASVQCVVTQTFDPPVFCNSKFTLAGGFTKGTDISNAGEGTISINGGAGVPVNEGAGINPANTDTTDVAFNGFISSIVITKTTNNDSGLILFTFKVDDVLLLDGSPVEVTSINAEATPPTLSVSGGDWLGTDGTGTVGGDTTVLAPLVTWGSSLTLADDTDLAGFTPGTAVVMNGPTPYQPVSSTITNVAETTFIAIHNTSTNTETVDTIEAKTFQTLKDDPTKVTNSGTFGNASFCSQFGGSDECKYFLYELEVPTAHVKIGLSPCTTGSTTGTFRLYATNDLSATLDSGFIVEQTGFTLGTNSAVIDTGSTPYKYFVFFSGVGPAGTISNRIGQKNYGINTSESKTVLTFADDQDIKYFDVGDVVQGVGISASDTYDMYVSLLIKENLSELGSSVESINFGTRPTTSGTYSTIIYDLKKSLTDVNFVRFLGATSSSNTFIYSGSNTGENDWVQIATGSNYPGPGDTSVSNGSTPYRYFRITTSPGALTVSDYGIDETILNQQISITDINTTANIITVDGGDWEGSDGSGTVDGETIVTCLSPLKDPVDYTVASTDPATNTMTLDKASPTTADVWVATDNAAGDTFTVKGTVETQINKLYCKLQQNTGNVISLQSRDPGYTDQVGEPPLSFNFPSLFPNGLTPDNSIPDGTTVCVDAKVANTLASDEMTASESGACLQPGLKFSEPITESVDDPVLVMASPAALKNFEANDDVYMTDVNGNPASYIPKTSTITNVVTSTSVTGTLNPSIIPNIGSLNNLFSPAKANPYANQNDDLYYGASFDIAVPSSITLTFAVPFTGNLIISANAAAPAVNAVLSCNGTTKTVPVPSVAGLIASYDLGYVVDATTITYNGSSTLNFWGILLNGQNFMPTDGVVLTVADDQDIKYFDVGDVVQSNWNQSQEWSSFASGAYVTHPFKWEQTFDGDSSTYGATPLENDSLLLDLSTLTGGGIAYTTSVVITYNRNTLGPDLTVNGSVVVTTADATDRTYTVNGSGLLFSVGSAIRTHYANGDIGIKQIEIDGKTLVNRSVPASSELNSEKVSIIDIDTANNKITIDGGNWTGSEDQLAGRVWSDSITTTGNSGNFANKKLIFDDDINTNSHCNGDGAECVVTFVIDPPLSVNSKVSFYGVIESSNLTGVSAEWNLNNESASAVYTKDGFSGGTAPSGRGSENIINYSGELSKITITKTSDGDGSGTGGIYAASFAIDGNLLVDANPDAPGETTVTTSAKSGTGKFVLHTDKVVTLTNSNNQWIDNQNRLGLDFYMKSDTTTVFNVDDADHVATVAAIKAAFDAFEPAVNSRRTSIASSFYRLLAGETLTAEESAALTSTVTTAVNASEPFALDGYYPLYYTAAAANVASSVGDHHTHDMEGETFYMPDGGTIYHGNYLAPEENSGY